MKIDKNFNNMTDLEKWDLVVSNGGYVSRWGYGIDLDLEHFTDRDGNDLRINKDFADHKRKLKKISRLEDEIRVLKDQISDLRFIIKKRWRII